MNWFGQYFHSPADCRYMYRSLVDKIRPNLKRIVQVIIQNNYDDSNTYIWNVSLALWIIYEQMIATDCLWMVKAEICVHMNIKKNMFRKNSMLHILAILHWWLLSNRTENIILNKKIRLKFQLRLFNVHIF